MKLIISLYIILICFFFQGHQIGISVAKPNDFELQYRPPIISHLPPLSAREVSNNLVALYCKGTYFEVEIIFAIFLDTSFPQK